MSPSQHFYDPVTKEAPKVRNLNGLLAYQEEAEVYYTRNTWESVGGKTAAER